MLFALLHESTKGTSAVHKVAELNLRHNEAIQRIQDLRDELGPLSEDAWEMMDSEDLGRHAAALETYDEVLEILRRNA